MVETHKASDQAVAVLVLMLIATMATVSQVQMVLGGTVVLLVPAPISLDLTVLAVVGVEPAVVRVAVV